MSIDKRWWTAALPLAVAALAVHVPACSSPDDEAGNVDTDVIAWVSPTPDATIEVDEAVELTVKVNDPSAKVVRFEVDGHLLATCDTTQRDDECRRDDLARTTTTFHAGGSHRLVAALVRAGGEQQVALTIEVHAASALPPATDGGAPDATVDGAAPDGGTKPPPKPPTPPTPVKRGFLDPDRASHNVFGGVSWADKDQTVVVTAPPAGSAAAVAACMKTYGASIIKWADATKISRASVVATAITESNCSNPAGSSDGLSSGPMQVTGSTCAAVVSGYSSAACKSKMHASADFSFEVGSKYMGGSYQLGQSSHDPPKIGAAYNAGSVRASTANRWHMVVTGNHIERWVGAYNAYRAWEKSTVATKLALTAEVALRPAGQFEGEHVLSASELPLSAADGQVYFVGNWAARDGAFFQFRDGRWQQD